MMLWRGMLLTNAALAAVEDFLCWKDVMWIDVINYVDNVAGFQIFSIFSPLFGEDFQFD